jgi:hypothetical protein
MKGKMMNKQDLDALFDRLDELHHEIIEISKKVGKAVPIPFEHSHMTAAMALSRDVTQLAISIAFAIEHIKIRGEVERLKRTA